MSTGDPGGKKGLVTVFCPDQIDVTGDAITVHTQARALGSTATLVAIVLYTAAVIHLAALLARLQDDDRRVVRRAMQLQSWHLRQLVPRPSSVPLRGTG